MSERQRAVLAYLWSRLARLGYPPTVREIIAEFEYHSLAAVHGDLEALEAAGYLRRPLGGARLVKILKTPIGSLRSLAEGKWGSA
jgi:repressor LexA